MPIDPVAGSELGEQRLVEPARRLHVEILDDGVLSKAGELQATDQPLVLALDRLAVDHQGEPFLEARARRCRADRRCSSSAFAMPVRPSATSRCSVGCVSIFCSFLFTAWVCGSCQW